MDKARDSFRNLAALNAGALHFLEPLTILEKQVMRPLYRWFKKEHLLPPARWAEAFDKDPDRDSQIMDHLVRVEFPTQQEDVDFRKTEYLNWANKMSAYPPNRVSSLQELVEAEIATSVDAFINNPSPVLQRMSLAKALVAPEMPRAEYRAFFSSNNLRRIPYLDITSRLHAAVRHYFPNRRFRPSDFNDIWMLSAYLPYCDVIATDKFWVELDRRRGVNVAESYGAQLFAATVEGRERLLATLDELIEARAAVTPHEKV